MKFALFVFVNFFLIVTSFEFYGQENWQKSYRELCDREEFETRNLYCLNQILLPKFINRRIEILSWQPALLRYHGFFDEQKVDHFLKIINNKTLVSQGITQNGKTIRNAKREANGSWIYWKDYPDLITSKEYIEKYLPEFNFTAAEPISSLSYHPGGHYYPHHDYLTRKSGEDWWMDNMRNRLATLIFVFQNAESGGGTVFPKIGLTVRAEPGDAFLWFSMRGDESLEDLSLHGGCPVYSGRKIIATIWIRAVNQPILSKILDGNRTISADLII